MSNCRLSRAAIWFRTYTCSTVGLWIYAAANRCFLRDQIYRRIASDSVSYTHLDVYKRQDTQSLLHLMPQGDSTFFFDLHLNETVDGLEVQSWTLTADHQWQEEAGGGTSGMLEHCLLYTSFLTIFS